MPIEIQRGVALESGRNECEGNDEIDPTAHAKLIDGINNLTGSHFIGEATRTEPSLQRTEFGLAKTKDDKVRLADLAKFFTKTQKHTSVVKQLNRLKTRNPLEKPLLKPVADRLVRQAGYQRAQKDLDRWEPVVTATKVAPQTIYPLRYGGTAVHDEPPKQLSEYRVKTKLMEEIEELEKAYGGAEEVGERDSDTDLQKYDLTLAEMREQQRERARQKIRQSYEIAKNRRMSKIKSKKFNRLLKKDKLKQQMKKFEEMKEKDPEEALRQLDQIEKQRFQERVTLRHKNTGTWAKNLQVRAKYDTEVRRELAEQLAISRELTAKRLQQAGSSSESDDELGTVDLANPWTQHSGEYERAAVESKKLTSGYRKYWEERNKIENMQKNLAVDDTLSNVTNTNGRYDNGLKSNDIDEERSTDNIIKPVRFEKSGKKRKEKIIMASGCWNVEDVEIEEKLTHKVSHLKPKIKKKVKDPVPNVEQLFQEAEELIQDMVENKLEQVQGKLLHEEELQRDACFRNRSTKQRNGSSDLSFKQKASLADADEQLNETTDADAADRSENSVLPTMNELQRLNGEKSSTVSVQPVKSMAEISMKKVVQMKPKHLLTALPDTVMTGELSDDEVTSSDTRRLTIAEAFEDDDIVADFAKEKQDARDKDLPQEVNLSLPGWGQWAGPGIKPRKPRQNARKIFKPPKELPRRDDNRDQVIINEDALKNEQLSKHLINEVPFPFVTVKDYEASLRAPIGRTFIPETAHAAMVEPRVVTRQGTVIEPMKKEILLEKPKGLRQVGKRLRSAASEQFDAFVDSEKLGEGKKSKQVR
ncbi:U3 small nucleolar RNA-associated protein 14 homolog A [Anopheles nili]|uniref:U3 small nucleolar RNA-associated protein 14 homolog A n=1 Tax=Anopheles nili TaxID=185578 RepID=UPI00237BB97E|nr:U3 small nucleolar RNA-associated protein 14 homolog A [Anopheles nili]